jgi:hypothetical protein
MDNQYVRQSLNSRRVCVTVQSLCLQREIDRQRNSYSSALWKTESRVSTMITDDTRFGLKCLALFIRVHAERERQSLTGQWHLLLTVDVTVCQEVMVGNAWTVKERKRDSRETCQWAWSRRKDEQYMIKRMWKNHMRDRETIRAGVWIIGMQDRVSSVLECVCSSLSLSSEKEGQTKQRSFCIQYETDRVERLLMRERQIVDNGAWIIMLRDRVSTLVEFMLVRLSLFRERQTDRETVWIINMKDRVPCLYNDHWWHSFRSQVPVFIHTRSCIISTPNRNKYSCMTLTHPWHSCMTHHDQSFVFECQVFQMSQVCPVFQSRSLCQDFYMHRLPPPLSRLLHAQTPTASSKNKKADFLQICTQFSIVLLNV